MIALNSRTMSHLVDRLVPRIVERLAARPRPGDLAGDPEELLSESVAATILGMQPSTLTAWRRRGQGPAFIRIGVKKKPPIRYKRGIVVAYRDRGIVNPSRG